MDPNNSTLYVPEERKCLVCLFVCLFVLYQCLENSPKKMRASIGGKSSFYDSLNIIIQVKKI